METNEKKKHILETAENLFANKGYEAATVRDIAEEAKVNLAMISYYFGSKEKLMESLFHQRMNHTKLRVEQLMKNESIGSFEKIVLMLDEYIIKVLENQAFYKILICEQAMKKNTVVLKLLREIKQNYATMFAALVFEGQKKKLFKKKIDVVLALNTMTGTVTQVMVNKDFYNQFTNEKKLTEKDLQIQLHEKLLAHLTEIFKTILGYES